MSDLDHRLAALDPAANETYQHPDLDAMIARIVATPANASARWQRIQARFAGGLIAATLVTAVSLVLVQGGPSLPVLAVQRALSAPSASFATAAPMQTNRDVHFRAGSGLSASAPHTDSYELKVPSNPKTETAALAAVFGVVGNATSRGANNWIDANASGAVLNYDSTGVPQWYYSSTSPNVAPATESGRAQVPVPSHTTVELDVRRDLRKLGFSYELGSPNFSTATTSTTTTSGAPLTVDSETVSYTVLVHGASINQVVSFTVDPSNALLYAQGPAFSVRRSVNYPLQSPRAGVATLNALERRTYASSVTKAPAATVIVTRDTLSLAGFQLKNHSLWLLPVYSYSGSGHRTAGATTTWVELAIEPAFVTGPVSVTNGSY